jgi:hypothetical protein
MTKLISSRVPYAAVRKHVPLDCYGSMAAHTPQRKKGRVRLDDPHPVGYIIKLDFSRCQGCEKKRNCDS